MVVLLLFLGCRMPGTPLVALPESASGATLMGIVTNSATGNPVTGAKITVNNQVAWSTAGGVYTLTVDPAGTYPVSGKKPGYEDFTSLPVNFQPGSTITLNIALYEQANPPGTASAWLDAAAQSVEIEWEEPSGIYELIYDDGIEDNFTLWATAGNMNAVRFTPASWPAQITGGSVHIGQPSDYPAGSNPLVPFQVRIYDATGTGGAPGSAIAGPFDVIPTGFGWVAFTLPAPVTITSGSYYLVMVQGGNAPNAAGLAIDETNPQFRSYSKFTGGGSQWFPGSGNFLMRTTLTGAGGPMDSGNPEMILGYQVWRLHQGEELNLAAWIPVGSTTATSQTDPSWPSLPCSPYRWGIKANYTGNRWSPVTFSNVIGKCWVAPVTVHVDLSCTAAVKSGINVTLTNQVYPDTNYSMQPDTSGSCTFPTVWKGSYALKVTKFGYVDNLQQVSVNAPASFDVFSLQERTPPSNLFVNDCSLVATWDVPQFRKTLLTENWSSGSFNTNGWTTQGGSNWVISATIGNPAPSAMFSYTPQALNYSQTLTSKPIQGQQAPIIKLDYDIYLDNFGTTALNQMAVEAWDGLNWNPLKTYSNSGGNIIWTTEEIDISGYSDSTFRIRFRAYGEDSYELNNWNIDNINVLAYEAAQGQSACILGYNVYLNNVVSGFAPENKYSIPGNHVQYGTTYEACVLAAYGSGHSDKICYTFTSHFLWPVKNPHGTAIENTALITWEQPRVDTSSTVPAGLLGYKVYRNDTLAGIISNPDSLSFYDTGLEPGFYIYMVTAWYDLSSYGFPGEFGESHPAGPVELYFNYGRPLPFYEPWDAGSFTFNDWRFTPGEGNWKIATGSGNPAPCALFDREPALSGYSFALESPAIDGTQIRCGKIWLDFDLKLTDNYTTGDEKLVVEIWNNNSWHEKALFANNGSFGWTTQHLDISSVKEKGFRIRFRAAGSNSLGIIGWAIDNVHIYPVCFPATNFAGDVVGYDAHLTWSAPDCNGTGNILNEGFESELFPPLYWTQSVTNPAGTWSHTNLSSPLGVHSGSYAASVMWDYSHQDERMIAHDIFVNGNLVFWSYAYQGSTHNDHYYVDISTDQGLSWSHLLDLSALPPYPSANGYNSWETPYTIDMTQYLGEQVDIAWHAVDGNSQGLWYPWAIDDCSMGGDKIVITDSHSVRNGTSGGRSFTGYDLYRRYYEEEEFTKVNQEPIPDTSYVDMNLKEGQHHYFVVPVFTECSRVQPSDTIVLDIITGTPERINTLFTAYPNPVSERLFISCATDSEEIREMKMMNAVGEVVILNTHPQSGGASVDVSGLPYGTYILQVGSTSGVFFFKVIIGKF